MKLLRIAGILACATMLTLVVVPRAAAPPSLPGLYQVACDSVILIPGCPDLPEKSARITFSLETGFYPFCSFELRPTGSFAITSCVAPPGWLCERTQNFGWIWRIDPAVTPCAVTPHVRIDNFQFRARSFCPGLCRYCWYDRGSPTFSVTYYDSTGTPITPSPPPVTFLCDLAVPTAPSTWGFVKSTYR